MRFGSGGHFEDRQRRGAGEIGGEFAGVVFALPGIEFGFAQPPDQLLHLPAVGAQGLRFYNLPVVPRIAAELDALAACAQRDARQGSGIERQQALVAQFAGALVQACAGERSDGEEPLVARAARVVAARGGHFVAQHYRVQRAILHRDQRDKPRFAEAEFAEVSHFLLDYLLSVQFR